MKQGKDSIPMLTPLSVDEVRTHFQVFRKEYEKSRKSTYWGNPKNDRVIASERVVAPYVFGFLRYATERLGGRETGIYYLDQSQKLWGLLQELGGAEIGAEYTRFTYCKFPSDGTEEGDIYVWQPDERSAVGLWFRLDSKIFDPTKWEEIIKDAFDGCQARLVDSMQSLQSKMSAESKSFEDFLRLRESFNV
jgi:hypothetical protein